jgi:hypothetical protein
MNEPEHKITEKEKTWFIKKFGERQPEFGSEIGWTVGLRQPKGSMGRPKWLKKCISRLCLERSRPPTFNNEQKRKISVLLAGAIEGIEKTSLAVLSSPTEREKELEKLRPEIKKLRLVAKAGVKKLLKNKSFPKANSLRPASMTGEERNWYYEAAHEASSEVVEDKSTTITADVLWWMWFFWREAEAASSRAELHKWISRDMRFVVCDFKIFEKVCRQIRFRSLNNKARRRGKAGS